MLTNFKKIFFAIHHSVCMLKNHLSTIIIPTFAGNKPEIIFSKTQNL